MYILLFLLGVSGFITSLIWILINLIRRKPLKTPLIVIIMAIVLFVTGIAIAPPPAEDLSKKVIDHAEESVASESEFLQLSTPDPAEAEEAKEPANQTVSGKLEVHFIDVGQGDSILIKTPLKNILIDGGPSGNTALDYLKNQGVVKLDYVISTHPHEDHIGGLINIIKSIPVAEIIDPAVVHTTQIYEEYIELIDQEGAFFTEGRAGMRLNLGSGAAMTILHPTSPSASDLNNACIVARLTFGEISFLFAGDAGAPSESQILKRSDVLRSTILKVGHHGSEKATTQDFLDKVKPEAAVIMCGKDNTYGYPHKDILERLSTANIEIYRTDLHGNIVVITDGKTYSIDQLSHVIAESEQLPPEKSIDSLPPPAAPLVPLGAFVGSKGSGKYHYPDCESVKDIKESNRVWFDSAEAAIAVGYVACKVCSPPGAAAAPPPEPPAPESDPPVPPRFEPEPEPPAPPVSTGVFVGSKNSDVYHYPNCSSAKKIKPSNLITFNSVQEARDRGYRPCKVCKPPSY